MFFSLLAWVSMYFLKKNANPHIIQKSDRKYKNKNYILLLWLFINGMPLYQITLHSNDISVFFYTLVVIYIFISFYVFARAWWTKGYYFSE